MTNSKLIFSTPQKKNNKIVVGLMSGTSVDGVSAALVHISGKGIQTSVKLLAYEAYPFPRGLKVKILENSLPGEGTVDSICRLNVLMSHIYADATKRIAQKGGIEVSKIDIIGSHGQTIQHLPNPMTMFGKAVCSTLQIGDIPTIAQLTGITTVGNFRTADMALGGQGAPLVPYVDYLLFRSQTKNRLLLNLGGIANFTVLPKQCRPEDVIAFDTGPANMVIDSLMRKFFKKEFDRNGAIAKRGKINELLLQWMLTHRYFKRKPPKSTGREMFGKFFVKDIMSRAKKLSPFEIIATATEFTPKSVYLQYEKFVHPICEIDELFVSGGGAKNTMIMNSLEKYFSFAEVKPFESVGFSSEAKEAVAFAILANETISGNPSNLPSVTGARKQTILGSIAIP